MSYKFRQPIAKALLICILTLLFACLVSAQSIDETDKRAEFGGPQSVGQRAGIG